MADSSIYHDGNRRLQDIFQSRPIADRLEAKLARSSFTAQDRALLEGASYFFIATADAAGRPDCSFKERSPGFVRVTAADELAFPDYDGNGMFKSLGNVLSSIPASACCSSTCARRPPPARVNGEARLSRDDALLAATVGAQLMVRVKARAISPQLSPLHSKTAAARGVASTSPGPASRPSRPAWKGFDDFKDVVHPRQPTAKGLRRSDVSPSSQSPFDGRFFAPTPQRPEKRHDATVLPVSRFVAALFATAPVMADRLASAGPASVGFAPDRLQRLTATLAAEIGKGTMPGAVLHDPNATTRLRTMKLWARSTRRRRRRCARMQFSASIRCRSRSPPRRR